MMNADCRKIKIKCMINPTSYNGFKTMKVVSIELKDIGGIPYINLKNLNPNFNIICGENGVGKTNILDSIAYGFSYYDRNIVNKRASSETGYIESIFINNDEKLILNSEILEFSPERSERNIGRPHNAFHDKFKFLLIYLKVNRVFEYKKEESVMADPDPRDRGDYNTAGLKNNDIKQWFIGRHLHSAHQGNLSAIQLKNIVFGRKCFSLLNDSYNFSRTTPQNEILVNTPTGEILFEYLSSGFKSILFILLGIIKEIEYRFRNQQIAAEDYDGIILIDEVELHLHPEWQGRICNILKEAFPKVQFFITTHSPHVIQAAEQNEVIAIERRKNEVVRRERPASEYGYQGWTVEEILEDVMGMQDLRTKKYKELKTAFDNALDEQNKAKAQLAYKELSKMLHPNYPLRALFEMQLNALGE